MASRNTHEWKERGEDGEVRVHRASRHLGRWTFTTRLKPGEDWLVLEAPGRAFLSALREKMLAKYRRRRLPWEHVEEIEKMMPKEEDG